MKVPLVKVHFNIAQSSKDLVYKTGFFLVGVVKTNRIYTKNLYLFIMYVINY
jgi:hypothetical protein